MHDIPLIKSISFPNTVDQSKQCGYRVGTEDIDKIERIPKNGATGTERWFHIFRKGKMIAEIKESVCDIFYE